MTAKIMIQFFTKEICRRGAAMENFSNFEKRVTVLSSGELSDLSQFLPISNFWTSTGAAPSPQHLHLCRTTVSNQRQFLILNYIMHRSRSCFFVPNRRRRRRRRRNITGTSVGSFFSLSKSSVLYLRRVRRQQKRNFFLRHGREIESERSLT